MTREERTVPGRVRWNSWSYSRSGAVGDVRGRQFNQDGFCQLGTESEAGITNLAKQIVLEGDDFDALVFHKAQFPQPLVDLGRCGQLANNHNTASPRSGKRQPKPSRRRGGWQRFCS